jgi:hypothetical protein
MFPENLVLDEVVTPKNFDELIESVETSYRVEHEQTTLESICLKPDGTVQTPAGELRVTRDFLEHSAAAIGMPLGYFYDITPELFCSNFKQRQAETTSPITICRVGDVATGLILDGKKTRYRPARTGDVLRAIRRLDDLSLRRASVSFTGVDVELVRLGSVVEPVVGDIVETGVAVSNSESGGRQLKAAAYSYRLVCTNGAVMEDGRVPQSRRRCARQGKASSEATAATRSARRKSCGKFRVVHRGNLGSEDELLIGRKARTLPVR